jgi:hypothetical protein
MTLSFKVKNQNGNFKLAKINGSYKIHIDGESTPNIDNYYYDNTLLMHFNDSRTGTYDPYGDYVSLLMHMDGTNNSTTFTDSSLYNRNITANGPAKLSSSQSMFGGASAVFDADTSYLRVTSGSDFAFPSDFTIECWVYFTNSSRGYQGIIGAHNGSDQTAWVLYLEQNNTLNFQTSSGSGWSNGVGSGETVTPNEWHHIAVSRSGSSLRIFVDGTLKGTVTNNVNVASGSVIDIGDYTCLNHAYNFTMSGYIDELRITKGIARYTSTFSIPTEAFPQILPLFVDSSAYNNSLIVSSASISSDSSKFGGYAGYFGGSSMIRSPGSDIWQLGTEDFTVESWINPSLLTNSRTIAGTYDGSNGGWRLMVGSPIGGTPSYGPEVSFTATNDGTEVDVIIPGVLEITRAYGGGIYNSVSETYYSRYSSPADTSWNGQGWSNICNYTTRSYYDWLSALYEVGRNPGNIVGLEMVMKHVPTNRYWLIKFSNWQGGGGGAFAYTRKEILGCVTDSSIIQFRNGDSSIIEKTTSSAIPTGTWSHVAAVRSSGVLNLYLNGTQLGSGSSFTSNITRNNSYGLSIGATTLSNGNSSDYFNGYLDDLRITKGVARYIDSFTVPSAPFENIGPSASVPSEPLSLTVSEDQGIVSLSWTKPTVPKAIDTRSPISYYGVEYSNNDGSSWTEDAGPFVVESTLNFNNLSDFTNNFTTTEPNYNIYSINNGSLQINCPTQDRISQFNFKQNRNLLNFEMRFSHTYDNYRVPSITFYGSLGSVVVFYNNNWPADQGWDNLGRNRNNVIVGVTPAGGSTTWYAHSSPRLNSYGQFDTMQILINTTVRTATLIINGISDTYNSNMFSGGFQNVYFDPMQMNYCTSHVASIDYVKYTTNDTSAANRRLYNLTSGSSYLFRVRAQNSVGFGNYSSTANISTLNNAPSGVSGIGDDNQAYVSWTAPTSNNSATRDYAIQYSSNAGASWYTYSRLPSTDTLSSVTGLSNGSDYIFRIAAVNFAGTGIYSSDSSSINVAPRSDNLYNKTRILLHLDSN